MAATLRLRMRVKVENFPPSNEGSIPHSKTSSASHTFVVNPRKTVHIKGKGKKPVVYLLSESYIHSVSH